MILNTEKNRGGGIEICGYKVDGYDKEKNIVFEYDEKHHYDVIWKFKRKRFKQNG